MTRAEIAIIGAGMAGASIAAELATRLPGAAILLIEGEDQPGYHSTGRSAAFWSETYGGPAVQPLTSASGDYLRAGGFLGPRGALHIADAGGAAALAALAQDFAGTSVPLAAVDRAALVHRLPGLDAAWKTGLDEPTCSDIDVAALHQHYLARARRGGVALKAGASVETLEREGGGWRIGLRGGDSIHAGTIVNAAGAWAGAVAGLAGAAPIVITPYRRTVAQIVLDAAAPADGPLVIDALGRFYFKPAADGRLWLSPHDETATDPCDAAPDELDIATAIDRFERLGLGRVLRVERAWAGLRSFAPDRAPVYGFDAVAPGFFWFAGQGGFGIQTAPAAAMIGAGLIAGGALPDAVAGIDVERYAPDRF